MKRLIYIITIGLLILLSFTGCEKPPGVPDLAIRPQHMEAAPSLAGTLTPNNYLSNAERLLDGRVEGPEDIILDVKGNLLISNADGRILKFTADGHLNTFAKTEGRPLGLRFDSKGNLIVCHEHMGLLSISPDGTITTLVPSSEQLTLLDDLVISADDIVYFSNATLIENLDGFYYDFLLHQPMGSIWSFNLHTQELKLVLDSLYFPNGLELTQSNEYLLINETPMYRILKFGLKGKNKGKIEVLVDNLPGFPDGLDVNDAGDYWLSFASPRKWEVDHIYSPNPWIKKILFHLPLWMRPGPEKYGFVIKINEQGEILESLHDPKGLKVHTITNTIERDSVLYFGSLFNNAVGKLDLRELHHRMQ